VTKNWDEFVLGPRLAMTSNLRSFVVSVRNVKSLGK
jgi:hypothetical protein